MPVQPKLYDCFTFFNELDLLDLRLAELAPVVHRFVIAEARQTFTGKPKPLHFLENRDRFAAYLPQIVHVVVDDFPAAESSWDREIHQRDRVRDGLAGASPDDILLLSDIDEIPRAAALAQVLDRPPAPGEVICLELDWHVYFLNVRLKEKWVRLGPRAIRVGSLATIDGLRGVYAPADGILRDAVRWAKACRRMRRLVRRRVIPDAGWHFSWLGGAEAVALKGSSISEHSHVAKGDKTADWALARIAAQLGDPSRYDLVPIDTRFPAFVRARPDLFGRYVADPSLLAGPRSAAASSDGS